MASSKHNTMEEEEGMRGGDSEEGTTRVEEEKRREEKRREEKRREEVTMEVDCVTVFVMCNTLIYSPVTLLTKIYITDTITIH